MTAPAALRVGYATTRPSVLAALPRLSDDSAREFAQMMMIDEPGRGNTELATLLEASGITPEPTPVSTQLQQESEALVAQLQSAEEGGAADRIYIDAQVTVHARVLALLEQQLIPEAENEELRQYLETVRGSVEQHHQHATTIQGQLQASGGVATEPRAE